MIRGQTVLAVIPARGGSKGIPRKNIREVGGKPLIAWTILEAKKSKYIDRLILSSEDPEIIAVGKEWGCDVPFVRPTELSKDETPGVEPVLHALESLPEHYEYAILLQPTSPLRLVEDIDGCLELCLDQHAPACVSVTEPDKSPYWMYHLDGRRHLTPLFPRESTICIRQNLPKVYALNGAVYVAQSSWLKEQRTFLTLETIGYIMPKERCMDIDTQLDLCVCEYVLSQRLIK
jgi:CMP-N,N'-diacetyllegionaminic acid synthase